MNYFVTSLRARKFSLLPKLVTAAALFLPSLPFMTPGNASAAPILWTDTEIATSFNFGNSAYVASVSCTSDTFCVAGGVSMRSRGIYHAFVSVYNGNTWVDQEVVGLLNLGGFGIVNSVSCTSSTSCVAVGQYIDIFNHSQAFVSVYNGSDWVNQEVAGSLNVGGLALLDSVSCHTSTFCVAGGQYWEASNHWQAFVSVYNGSDWVNQEVAGSINLGGRGIVNSVSCTSSTSCVAGGSYRDSSNYQQAFVSVYNGGTWVDQEVAGLLSVGKSAVLRSVSCASSTSCVAGGSYVDSSNNQQAFVSVYNGSTWVDQEVAGSLNVGGDALLSSVSCPTSAFCIAGGQYTDSSLNGQAFTSISTLHSPTTTTSRPVTPARVSGAVYFASGSSSLTVSTKHTLNTLATQIVSQSQSSVNLNGYTSSSEVRPAVLSLQRANSVKNFLKSKLISLGDTHITFVVHGRGVTRSGSSFAKDRKVTLS